MGEQDMAVEGGLEKLLDGWMIGKAEEEPLSRIVMPMKNLNDVKNERLDKMDVTKEPVKIATKEEDLDSDDDDLPAFDMSNDTPVTEETKIPILYIRDVIHHLSDTESSQGKRCLQLVPSLASTLNTKFLIIDCLVSAGVELAESN